MSLLSKDEVMEEFDISQATYYRYVKQGMPMDDHAPHRYDKDKIYEWMEKRSNVSKANLELGQLYTHDEIALMLRVDVRGKVRLTDNSLSFALLTDDSEWFGRTVLPVLDEATCHSLSTDRKPYVFNREPEGLRYMGYGKLAEQSDGGWLVEMEVLYIPTIVTDDAFDYNQPYRIVQKPVHLEQ